MKNYVFGIDVGGTTVKCGLFTADGTVLDKWEIKTNKENGGASILGDIAAAINEKLAEKNIEKDAVLGVGIGVPGPVKSDGTDLSVLTSAGVCLMSMKKCVSWLVFRWQPATMRM